jgi:hypothetical protein
VSRNEAPWGTYVATSSLVSPEHWIMSTVLVRFIFSFNTRNKLTRGFGKPFDAFQRLVHDFEIEPGQDRRPLVSWCVVISLMEFVPPHQPNSA